MREQREQCLGRIGDDPLDTSVNFPGGHGELRDHRTLRTAVVQEGGVEIEHVVALERDDQPVVAGELAEISELDSVTIADRLHCSHLGGIDGEHHAFLGFGEPDLPGAETRVLERRGAEFDPCADAFGHLADGGGEPAGAAIGDRGEQALCFGEHFHHQLLGDRVPDLDARSCDLAGRGIHRGRGEGGATQAVSAGPPADGDDPVAGLGTRERRADIGDADAPTEHQRIGGVGRVVQDRSGDGWKPHLVAVVGHTGDDAGPDAAGVQHTIGELGRRQIGRAEAEDVGAGDRVVSGTEDVADHAADAGVGPAERLDRGRVVVGLGLQRQGAPGLERDDAGVAHERRDDERSVDRVGRVPQSLQQRGSLVTGRGGDSRPERLVSTVLAPGLSDRLELDIGRVAALVLEPGLQGEQLLGVEIHASLDVHRREFLGCAAAYRDRSGRDQLRLRGVERRLDLPAAPPLDDGIGEQPLDEPLVIAIREVSGDRVAHSRRCGLDRETDLGGDPHDLMGDRIRDAGLEHGLDHGAG